MTRSRTLASVLFSRDVLGLGTLAVATGLVEYRGFCKGIDLARETFGDWNMRDPINDLKTNHAGAVAFRSVFA